MNLHGLISGAIGSVNPFVTVTINASTGYTTDAAGARMPTYSTLSATTQIQALSATDLKQIDSLNIQGIHRKLYFYGEVDGIIRSLSKGGDTVTFPDSSVWLVTLPTEQWPDWCAVVVTLQDGS